MAAMAISAAVEGQLEVLIAVADSGGTLAQTFRYLHPHLATKHTFSPTISSLSCLDVPCEALIRLPSFLEGGWSHVIPMLNTLGVLTAHFVST